jgi:hypothetical protein
LKPDAATPRRLCQLVPRARAVIGLEANRRRRVVQRVAADDAMAGRADAPALNTSSRAANCDLRRAAPRSAIHRRALSSRVSTPPTNPAATGSQADISQASDTPDTSTDPPRPSADTDSTMARQQTELTADGTRSLMRSPCQRRLASFTTADGVIRGQGLCPARRMA